MGSTLGFDNYVEPLKLYLQKYREAMKGERQMEAELSNLGGEVMAGQQLQALTASEGDVLLTYSNGQQFPVVEQCHNSERGALLFLQTGKTNSIQIMC